GIAVNPATGMVYVSSEPAQIHGHETVAVINPRTFKVTKVIDMPRYPYFVYSAFYAIAVDPRSNMIYVANNNIIHHHGTVSVIDGRTNKITATIPVRILPNLVAVDQRTDKIYVAYSGHNKVSGNTVSVIDGHTNK